MASRAAQANTPGPSVDAATAALHRVSLGHEHPSLRAANSFPLPNAPRARGGGMAGRRIRPNFSLKDIDATAVPTPPGGGALGAGLGAGRPSLGPEPPKRPPAGNFGSPFSNFSKIV